MTGVNNFLNWGMFGENVTTEGLMKDDVNVGDQFQIGSAKLVATQPSMPCYKLGVKFGRVDIVRRFLVRLMLTSMSLLFVAKTTWL